MIKKLIVLADSLDRSGHHKESDYLDKIISEAAKKKSKKKKSKKKSGKRTPTKPALWERAKAEAKKRFDVYPCVPTKNSFALTKKGWRSFEELKTGEEIVSYNIKNNYLEWSPILNLSFYENADTIKMYKPNTNFNFICTEDHKWIKKNVKTKYPNKLKHPDQLITAKDINKKTTLITSAKMKNGKPISLHGFRKKKWSWVEKVLNMSNEQREAWLASAIIYDGNENNYSEMYKRASYGFSQKEKDHAEATEICAALLGYNVSFREKKYNSDITHFTIIDRQTHSTGNVKKEAFEKLDVWCPETENGTWLMKQGNMITITGNSAYANGWAAKWYKGKGGGWKGKKPIK